ncbi:esterase B1-like [Musca vetustissima]|uniref:esterase B1-like n=1 Tax=Musca vetustissima TaxID=27455 RepID=UPI002AB7E475|nr:esterase B1-like [Musca vetustissima]
MEFKTSLYQHIQNAFSYINYKLGQLRQNTNEYRIVKTSYGQVKGIKHLNSCDSKQCYFAYEGIPFARPPLNELRFRAPQPPEPWQGILNCTRTKSKPCQLNGLFGFNEGSEDCLYLNVYVKESTNIKRPLPVMVWIYGGGFQYGEATTDLYNPDFFMMKDVIVVTFNYRLGVFGFLCFDDPKLNVPGNAGIKDQFLAIKWIKENIHNFNGDTNNITVFGESAGAVSAHMLMMCPQAKGLFHKVILQSGSALCPWGFTDKHDWGYKLACHLGYTGDNIDAEVYNFLVEQKSKRLTTKLRDLLTDNDILENNLFCAFVPVAEPYMADDSIITKPPSELLSTAWGNSIPVVIGGNSAEGLFYYYYLQHHKYLYGNSENVKHFLPNEAKNCHSSEELEKMAHNLREVYFKEKYPNIENDFSTYLEIMGHKGFWHPMYQAIKARSNYAKNVPTYCYYFDFVSPKGNFSRMFSCGNPQIKGAGHGDEHHIIIKKTNN